MRQSDGAILRRLDFDAYGRKLATSSGTMDIVPFGFAGGLWDPDTGLVRFGARDYDPETGRWLTKDPSRFGGGTNFYEYAAGDPVNRIDPTGNSWLVVVGLGLLWLDLALTVESHDDPDLLIAAAGAGVGEAAGAAFKVARAAYAAREAEILCKTLSKRASELHSALDPIARAQRTTAVLRTGGGDVIAGGARDLSPAQRALLKSGEIASKQPGAHAEATALGHAAANGLSPEAIAVSRSICPACADLIRASGGTLTSETTAVWPR